MSAEMKALFSEYFASIAQRSYLFIGPTKLDEPPFDEKTDSFGPGEYRFGAPVLIGLHQENDEPVMTPLINLIEEMRPTWVFDNGNQEVAFFDGLANALVALAAEVREEAKKRRAKWREIESR